MNEKAINLTVEEALMLYTLLANVESKLRHSVLLFKKSDIHTAKSVVDSVLLKLEDSFNFD